MKTKTKIITLLIIISILILSLATFTVTTNVNRIIKTAKTENREVGNEEDFRLSNVQYYRQTGQVIETDNSGAAPQPGSDNSPNDNYVRSLDMVLYELEFGLPTGLTEATVHIKGTLPNQESLNKKIIQWDLSDGFTNVEYSSDNTVFEADYTFTASGEGSTRKVSGLNALVSGWVDEGIVNISSYTPKFEICLKGHEEYMQTITDTNPLYSSAKDVLDIQFTCGGSQKINSSDSGVYVGLTVSSRIVGDEEVKGRVYPRGTITIETELNYVERTNNTNVLEAVNNAIVTACGSYDNMKWSNITSSSVLNRLYPNTFYNAKGGAYDENKKDSSVYNAGNMSTSISGNKLTIQFSDYDLDGHFPTMDIQRNPKDYGYFLGGLIELYVPYYTQASNYTFKLLGTKLSYDNKVKNLSVDETNEDYNASNNEASTDLITTTSDERTITQIIYPDSKSDIEGKTKKTVGTSVQMLGEVTERRGAFLGDTKTLMLWNSANLSFDSVSVRLVENYNTDYQTINPKAWYTVQYGVYKASPTTGITTNEELNVATYDDFSWYNTKPEDEEISAIYIVSNRESADDVNGIYQIRNDTKFTVKNDAENIGKTTYVLMRTNVDKDDNGNLTWVGDYNQKIQPATYNEQGAFMGSQEGYGVYLQTVYMQAANLDLDITVDDLDEDGTIKKLYDLIQDKEINYSITPRITETNADSFDNVKVEVILPAELEYKIGSSSMTTDSIEKNEDGTTTLTYLYSKFDVKNVEPIKLTATINPFTNNNAQIELNANIYMKNAVSVTKKYVVSAKNDVALQVNRELEKVIIIAGETSNVEVSIRNNTIVESNDVRIIEQLPQDGINGSVVGASYNITMGEIASGHKVYMSTKTLEELIELGELQYNQDIYVDSTNANFSNTAIWQPVTSNQDITGAKILVDCIDKLDSMEQQSLKYQISTTSDNVGDIYRYQAYASKTADSGLVATKTSINEQYVIDNAISGIMWEDENKDGLLDSNEKRISNITVVLVNADTNEEITTTTNSDGSYKFSGVKEGTYYVKVPTIHIGYTVTDKEIGNDTTINSKLNIDTKQTDLIQYNIDSIESILMANYINIGLKKSTFEYKVEYYYDGVIDNTKTETTQATYGDEINTYTDKNIVGYKFEKTENLPLTVSENPENNVIKVYYVKNTFNYTVEYYYDGVLNEENTETYTATYQDVIENYEDKNISGYKLDNTENLPLTISENPEDNVIKVYYVKDIFGYKVEYYYDGVIDNTKTETIQATYGDEINTYTDKNISGYRLDNTENLPLTVSENPENNVIKVYYVKDVFGYKVEYYYNGVIDNTKTEIIQATYGDEINTYTDKNIVGYKFEKTENLPLTVSENPENNVIKVYYVKDVFEYTVEYYYDGVLNEENTETYTTTYQDVIEIYEDKNIVGYKLEKTENLPLTVSENPDNNIIKIYYIRKDAKVIVKYLEKDTNEVLDESANYIINGKVFDEYETEQKEFEGYTFVESTNNTIGTMTENEIEVIYYYKKQATVKVEYIDKQTGEKLDEEEIKGNVGDSYETKEKEIEGYELIEIPSNSKGKMEEEEILVQYYYKQKAEVEIQYVEKDTNNLLSENDNIQGYVEDPYETKAKDISYYKLVDQTQNTKGTMKKEKITVIYYYEKLNFNITVDKWISKVSVDGVEKTAQDYNTKEQIYKLDIHRTKVNTANVKITYIIRITNTGEIEGTVGTLTEIIPQGYNFNQDDNQIDWKESNGILTTDTLKDEPIEPGEYKEIEITLRWNTGESNFGEKDNTAIISNLSNPAGYEDTNEEDNSSKSQMILTIATGLDRTSKIIVIMVVEIVLIITVGLLLRYKKKRK